MPTTMLEIPFTINHFMANRKKMETVTDFIFLGSRITVDTAAMKLKDACFLQENLDSVLAEKLLY